MDNPPFHRFRFAAEAGSPAKASFFRNQPNLSYDVFVKNPAGWQELSGMQRIEIRG